MPLKYWISSSTSNWDNTANWSLSSGGSGGAAVPGSDDTAMFNALGLGPCLIDATARVFSLEFDTSNFSIDGSVATDYLVLRAGNCADGTVHVKRDIYNFATYGSWTNKNNLNIVMDGDSTQHIYNEIGCIMPNLTIDKS